MGTSYIFAKEWLIGEYVDRIRASGRWHMAPPAVEIKQKLKRRYYERTMSSGNRTACEQTQSECAKQAPRTLHLERMVAMEVTNASASYGLDLARGE